MLRLNRFPVLLAFIALLTACGGSPTAAPTSAPAAVATSAPTSAPEATVAPTSAPAATVAPTSTLAATSAPTATVAPAASSESEVVVFAAASLTEAFKEIAPQFAAANNGATVTFNFAGSDQLAQQIIQGAPADVFASANKKQMDVAITAGEVVSGTAHTFVRNRLVLVYPQDNPAKIAALKDLANPGIKLVLANKSVPVGGYALDFLAKASKLPEYTDAFSATVLGNVVSYEDNVKAVLSKVVLGEADAGIVYATDVTQDAASKVTTLEIPDNLNTIATYPIAPTKNAKNPELAQKFVAYVLSPDGQQILAKYGFIPTTGSATGAAPTAAPLAIGGMVDTPLTLALADFNALQQVAIKAKDRDGAEQTYTGVPIATLLERAGVKSGATKLIFTGGDGYTAEVTLADLKGDADAIIAADANGAFRDIVPSQMPKVWVKGLTKIDVQ